MKFQMVFAFSALLFAVSAAPASSTPLSKAVVPSKDSFYRPDSGYESQPVGTILRYRQVLDTIGLIVYKTNIKAAYQLLVRSQDTFGNPTAIVTTVLIPWNADPNKVLSYQVAEDSADSDCAPSYAIQLSSDPLSWAITQFEQAFSNSDHLGPKAAFGVGLQAGYAALDTLKALTQSGNFTGVSSNPRIALWGYSGGSQPSTWGVALAPAYAPDLNIVGVAAGGVTTSWQDILNANDNSSYGFLVPSIFAGFGNEYPVFNQYLEDNLYPDIKTQFYEATKQCGNAAININTTWQDLSPKGGALIDDPTIADILDANNLNNLNATPKSPVFIYSATQDNIVPARGEEQLYAKWCSEGATVTYREDQSPGHVIETYNGARDAFTFVRDRLNGVPLPQGCQKIDSESNLLNSDSVLGLSIILLDLAKLAFNVSTGPASSLTSSDTHGLPVTFYPSEVHQNSTGGFSVDGLPEVLSTIQTQINTLLKGDPDSSKYNGIELGLSNTSYLSSILELTEGITQIAEQIAGPNLGSGHQSPAIFYVAYFDQNPTYEVREYCRNSDKHNTFVPNPK